MPPSQTGLPSGRLPGESAKLGERTADELPQNGSGFDLGLLASSPFSPMFSALVFVTGTTGSPGAGGS